MITFFLFFSRIFLLFFAFFYSFLLRHDQSMTSSSNKALDSFESFINKEGENVQENLGNHFRVLDSHFIAQNTEIESVNSMSDEV